MKKIIRFYLPFIFLLDRFLFLYFLVYGYTEYRILECGSMIVCKFIYCLLHYVALVMMNLEGDLHVVDEFFLLN